MKRMRMFFVVVAVAGLLLLGGCGQSGATPPPSAPVVQQGVPATQDMSPEEYMERAAEVVEELNEAAGGSYVEEAVAVEQEVVYDFAAPPRADQIVEIAEIKIEDIYGLDWETLTNRIRTEHALIHPELITEIKCMTWSKATGLASRIRTLFTTVSRTEPSERHPEDPTFLSSISCLSFIYTEAQEKEIREYWAGLSRNLFESDWQFFIDDEQHRYGYVKFLNGAKAGDGMLTYDDYILLQYVIDEGSIVMYVSTL
jgi:hypothetical protein